MNAQMKRITDCAEVLPGYALKARAEHEPEGIYQIIMAKHLDDCTPYTYSANDELRMTPKGSVKKYIVQQGDVLFISRGVRNCASKIEDVPEKTVASGTFYILRAKAELNPDYLAWCLNQAPIQAQIGQIRTGAGTPIVQRAMLGDLEIPCPDMATQEKLASLGNLMIKERQLRQALIASTEQLHRAIGQALIVQLRQPM